MRPASRCADCWTCFTLLAPPDLASTARDRARVVSLCTAGAFVVFFVIFTETSIRTYKNISIWKIIMSEPRVSRRTDRLLSLWPWLLRFESSTWCFSVCFLFQCKNMHDRIIDDDWSVVRAIEKSVLYTYLIVLLALLLLLCALLLFFLFPLRRHRVRFRNRTAGPDQL